MFDLIRALVAGNEPDRPRAILIPFESNETINHIYTTRRARRSIILFTSVLLGGDNGPGETFHFLRAARKWSRTRWRRISAHPGWSLRVPFPSRATFLKANSTLSVSNKNISKKFIYFQPFRCNARNISAPRRRRNDAIDEISRHHDIDVQCYARNTS